MFTCSGQNANAEVFGCTNLTFLHFHSPCSDSHSDRPHARSSSSMGDAEGLVQVEMRHVGAIISRTTQTHLENRNINCLLATVAVKFTYHGYHFYLETILLEISRRTNYYYYQN